MDTLKHMQKHTIRVRMREVEGFVICSNGFDHAWQPRMKFWKGYVLVLYQLLVSILLWIWRSFSSLDIVLTTCWASCSTALISLLSSLESQMRHDVKLKCSGYSVKKNLRIYFWVYLIAMFASRTALYFKQILWLPPYTSQFYTLFVNGRVDKLLVPN